MQFNFFQVSFEKLSKLFSPEIWINTFYVILGKKLPVYWWRKNDNKNWGDKINKYIIESLSGKDVVHQNDVFNNSFLKTYSCVGSVVELLDYKNVNIWGSGIIRRDSYINLNPGEIYAVRGPLTRERLIEAGYKCPEVYGDPALLMPKLYQPKVKKKYELGIIPHYIDKNLKIIKNLQSKNAFIIDVFDDELEFIDQVNRCQYIASSSLHGLIVADAYRIPSKWIKISDDIVGDGFKFYDYYKSIGVKNEEPLDLNDNINQNEIIESCWLKSMKIDLDLLLESCPFYENDLQSARVNK